MSRESAEQRARRTEEVAGMANAPAPKGGAGQIERQHTMLLASIVLGLDRVASALEEIRDELQRSSPR